MTDAEIEQWAIAYINAQLDPRGIEGELGGAIEDFMIDNKPSEDCWKAIVAILKRDPPDKVIGVLAAGPLEDLISEHGEEFIDRIELEARRDPAFRDLLRGVWKSSTPPEIWSRIEKARDNISW